MKDLDHAGIAADRSTGLGGSASRMPDYPKHFRDFAMCMAILRNDVSKIVYFGNPEKGNHHRVMAVPTPAGLQFAFHRESTQLGPDGLVPIYGSGEYIGGIDGSPESAIDVANRWLQDYYKPAPHKLINERMDQIRARDAYHYYIKDRLE